MCDNTLTYESLNKLPVWQHMATISLEDMRAVRLMNRIDTKYVLSNSEVLQLLDMAAEQGYRVQCVGQARACRYDTLYYDTAERSMYLMHHNRVLRRQKIRTRIYVESDTTFLEVKNKSNRGRTNKQRVEIARCSFDGFGGDTSAMEFLASMSWYDVESLTPALATRFTRITLVNPRFTERLTIDLDLDYCNCRDGVEASIVGMAIVELKQDGRIASPMKEMLRVLRVPAMKVSKYCLGTALTVENIRKNRFKLKLRSIEKRLSGLNVKYKQMF